MVRVEERSDIEHGVMLITIDRPERRNAVDHATLVALREAQQEAAGSNVVVLTGTPPAFSAGADLTGVEEDEFAGALSSVLRGFTELSCPVIAAIDGPALGAGAQLASVCDLRIATPESMIGVPAARLGLVIDRWTIERFRAEFGDAVTRDMLLAASIYSAERLHVMGSVHRLGDLDDALAWAARIAALAPLSIAAHKRAFEAADVADDATFEAARRRAWASADAAEGRAAFLEKRPARFRGE